MRPATFGAGGLLLAFAAGCYTGEGSGEVAYETYEAAGFSRIALSGAAEVTVEQGDFAVTASAEDNVLPTLVVYGQDDTLILGRDVDWIDGIRPTVPIRIVVAVPELAGVSVSGSGRVVVRGVGANAVSFTVSGSAGLDLTDVPAKVVEVEVEGAGTLDASGIDAVAFAARMRGAAQAVVAGRAEAVHVDVAGSVLYRGAELRAQRATVAVDGAAQAFVWVDEALDARVGGVGRLGYRGSPVIERTIQREGRMAALGLPAPESAAGG